MGISDLCIGTPRGWMSTSDYNEATSSPEPRQVLTEEELLEREKLRFEQKEKLEKFEAEERPHMEKKGYNEVMAIVREFGKENVKTVNYKNFKSWGFFRGTTFTKNLLYGKVCGTWSWSNNENVQLKITHYIIFKDGKQLKRKWKLKLVDY
jgi:hypothetical protein